MVYPARMIPNQEAIRTCPAFTVNHFLWTCRRKPETTGQMGVIPGQGLFVRMQSQELNPRRTYTQPMDRVCEDSAMEAFFTFPAQSLARQSAYAPSDDDLYFNFEVNPLGAMYACHGTSRENRTPLTAAEFAATGVTAGMDETGWWMAFTVPHGLLQRLTGQNGFAPGDVFFANFYKISETPEIEHYAAWANIPTPTPNFHHPRFFARVCVE